jgi:hypothetical protein
VVRPRVFTVAEANQHVPRLAHLMQRIQQAALDLDAARANAAATPASSAVALERLLGERPELRRVVEELDAAVAEVRRLGAELKDLRLGLIDFPARLDGKDVYLCWQFGEEAIGHWHRRDEGFAGRRALPGAPAVRSLH